MLGSDTCTRRRMESIPSPFSSTSEEKEHVSRCKRYKAIQPKSLKVNPASANLRAEKAISF